MSNIKTTYTMNGKKLTKAEYRRIVAKAKFYEDLHGEKLTHCSIDLKVTQTGVPRVVKSNKDFGYYYCTGESWDNNKSAQWNRERRWNN